MKAYTVLFGVIQGPAAPAFFIEHLTIHRIALEAVAHRVLHILFMPNNFWAMKLAHEVNVVVRLEAVTNGTDGSP